MADVIELSSFKPGFVSNEATTIGDFEKAKVAPRGKFRILKLTVNAERILTRFEIVDDLDSLEAASAKLPTFTAAFEAFDVFDSRGSLKIEFY